MLLGTFNLPIFEFDWRAAAEDADRNTEFAALRVDFFDDAILALERTIGDLDDVADFETDGRAGVFFALLDLG